MYWISSVYSNKCTALSGIRKTGYYREIEYIVINVLHFGVSEKLPVIGRLNI